MKPRRPKLQQVLASPERMDAELWSSSRSPSSRAAYRGRQCERALQKMDAIRPTPHLHNMSMHIVGKDFDVCGVW